ncbi:MAG: pirin family protein [Acidobacteriota bacterium]
MITVRLASERGHFDHGWLDTYHSFSFGEYQDPEHMGFRSLRVINEDRVQPGAGFPTHHHRDMEIITWVVAGSLSHKDSLGNEFTLQAGAVQRMSAGTGVTHSEFNASDEHPVHFLQIWVVPAEPGMPPGYEEHALAETPGHEGLQLLASPDGRLGALTIHQDTTIWTTRLSPGQETVQPVAPGRHGWVQLIGGEAQVNGRRLQASDGAALTDESRLHILSQTASELLFFDLA